LCMSSAFAGSYVKVEAQQSYIDFFDEKCGGGFESCTDNPRGYRLAYGYSFNDYIGIELGYGKTGKFEGKLGEDSVSVEFTNFDIAALTRIPINDVFAITGKFGYNNIIAQSKAYDDYWDRSYSDEVESDTLVYGVGVEIFWFTMGYELINEAETRHAQYKYLEIDNLKRLYAGVKFSF